MKTKPRPTTDTLRDVIVSAAKRKQLNATQLSRLCNHSPTPEAVSRYLRGRASLTTAYVSRICHVLGLVLKKK